MKKLRLFTGVLATIAALTAIPVTYAHADEPGTKEVATSVELLHTHSGNPSENGGCYTTSTTCGRSVAQHTAASHNCGQYLTQGSYWSTQYNCTIYTRTCPVHGTTESRTAPTGNESCTRQVGGGTYYACNSCGTRYSGAGVCTKITGYALSCEAAENEVIGKFIITKERTGISYFLEPSVETESALCKAVSYTWNDGTVGNFPITGNGTYSCTLRWKDNGVAKTATLNYEVTDYDTEPPVITNLTPSKTTWTNQDVIITVTATDNFGVTAYRLNNGKWVTDNKLEIASNGTYTIYAKDAAGNISDGKKITISNIDHTLPTGTLSLINGVEVLHNGKIWTDKVTASVLASDNIALAEKAYSFDSENYSADNSKMYNTCGSYTVTIKDHVGNEKELTFEINNIDSTNPTVGNLQFEYEDADGNTVTTSNQGSLPKLNRMEITYTAEDTESGLPVLAYRYKKSTGEWSDWGSESKLPGLILNGTYTIEVRDSCGNTASKIITITNLLEEFPVTYLDVDENGNELGRKTVMMKTGKTASGSEMGIDPKTGAYYEGYDYINCDSITVGAGENIVHRYFKLHNYSVTYYDESHNIVFKEYVAFGKPAHSPESPIKKSIVDTYFAIDFEFAGWVDKNGNLVDMSSVKTNISLFPTYTEKKTARTYTVQFCVDGIVVDVQKVIAGESAVAPENLSKSGYTFARWDRSFSSVVMDMTVNAIFTVNPYSNRTEEIVDTTEITTKIPSAENIALLMNTEVEYLESKITSKKAGNKEANSAAGEEPDLEELMRRRTIYSEDTPLSGFFKTVHELYENEETSGIAITTTATLGMVASYSFISILCSVLGGFSLTQLLIFGYMLLRKKTRFVRGAWLTDTENVRYVDKYGRTVAVERNGNRLVFKRKGKVLSGIDVNNLLKRLNSNKITYKEFEDIIAASEVFTSFSKDLEIETWNVKAAHGKAASKAKGFSMTKNLRRVFDSAGNYAVKLTQNGRQAMFEIKYALSSV